MDDNNASNAQFGVKSAWRKRVTSTLRLPVSKSERSRNRRQENSRPFDEPTKQKGPVNELSAVKLLTSDSRVAVPETETDDNDAMENGTSNENYVRFADDEDQSWADCRNEIDKHEKSCVNLETSNISHMSGSPPYFFTISCLITAHKRVMFLLPSFSRSLTAQKFHVCMCMQYKL